VIGRRASREIAREDAREIWRERAREIGEISRDGVDPRYLARASRIWREKSHEISREVGRDWARSTTTPARTEGAVTKEKKNE